MAFVLGATIKQAIAPLNPGQVPGQVEVLNHGDEVCSSDEQVLALWLHGRSEQTKHAYSLEVRRFLKFVGKALSDVTPGDLQKYLEQLEFKAVATQARCLHCLKSLYDFAFCLGYVQFNVTAPIKAPKVPGKRAARILPEWQVQMMIATESHPRNRAILALLYAAVEASIDCKYLYNKLGKAIRAGNSRA